jgi:DNA-directed RNA polymerase subunit RPC12/RpoP
MSEVKQFKCPNCDGGLEFDTKTQKLKCPYCDGTYEPELFDEKTGFVVDGENWEDNDLSVYTCNSCGGTIMSEKNTVASSCPYCNNPVVFAGNVSGIYKPKKIIPFVYDKKQAKQKYHEFLKGKTLLPNAFKSEAVIDEIKGVYVPYWIFDGKAYANMWFDATKIREWSDDEYDYTETSYYKLFRSGRVDFDEVPVDASRNVADDLAESIEPFNYKEAKNYSNNYLPGFYADKYDVEVDESRKIANNRIANSTESIFSSTTSEYDTCQVSSSQISIDSGKQEYVMYPVWLLNVEYAGKLYTFAMNGQTGKFVGDLPSDRGKHLSIMFGIFIAVTVLLTLIQYLLVTR